MTGVTKLPAKVDEKNKIAKNDSDDERNRSFESCDSDDLYGGLAYSDEEDGANQRQQRKEKRVKANRRQANHYKQEVDTNIFKISFDDIAKKEVGQVDGEMPQCQSCKAYISVHSNLQKIEGSDKLQWKCEFCETTNHLEEKDLFQPEEEEIEIVQEVGKIKPKVENTKTTDGATKESDEISVVFCVDISGSMSTSSNNISRLECVKQAMIKQVDHMH